MDAIEISPVMWIVIGVGGFFLFFILARLIGRSSEMSIKSSSKQNRMPSSKQNRMPPTNQNLRPPTNQYSQPPSQNFSQYNQATTLQPNIHQEVARLMQTKQKIAAIKIVQLHTGMRLGEAKKFVETFF